MEYVNKTILSLILLVFLTTIESFSIGWQEKAFKLAKENKALETINENKVLSLAISFFGIGGLIYGTNSGVRSTINNGVSKTTNFVKSKAVNLYNKIKQISPKKAAIATTGIAAAVGGTMIGKSYLDESFSDQQKALGRITKNGYDKAYNWITDHPKASSIIALGGAALATRKLYDRYSNKNIAIPEMTVKKQLFNDLKNKLIENKEDLNLKQALESRILDVAETDYSILLYNDFYNLLTDNDKLLVNMLNDINPAKKELEYKEPIYKDVLYDNFLTTIDKSKLEYLIKNRLLGANNAKKILLSAEHENFYESLTKDEKEILANIITTNE